MNPEDERDETSVFLPRLVPTLITVGMLIVLIGLGVWQVQRAEWKGALIAKWQEQTQAPALDELPPPEKSSEAVFRKARLLGHFMSDKSVQLRPRTIEGKMGSELITPLKMLSGEVVLVDRGFVADETTSAIDQPIGAVFVEGELREFPKKGWMQPENKPGNEQWYWLDPAAIARAKNLPQVYPLELLAEGKPVNSVWPRPAPPGLPYTNNHLVYAFIWFSLALALAVIYFLSQMKAKKD